MKNCTEIVCLGGFHTVQRQEVYYENNGTAYKSHHNPLGLFL